MATAVRHVAGLAELVSRLGAEITSLVQEVHAASSPAAILTARTPAPEIYGSIRFAFRGAGRLARLGGRLAGREAASDAWLDVQSAVNGVFGHLLAESGSSFALPMSLHPTQARHGRERLIVFVHGLCMNERAWRKPAHVRFVEWARREGAAVTYVRYNTGRHVSTNGGLLADLLEREAVGRETILIGHSMGGLVALSALHQAESKRFDWPRRVTRLACLGSPHEGTSLERLGNHANRLLNLSPWSRPFMRLGNLRSDGIRDLRFGHLIEDDWRGRSVDDPRRAHTTVTLASHVDHLFVAAVRSGKSESDPVGDWLVPVESALARSLHRQGIVRRELIRGLDHLGLLRDERVYKTLRDWLDERR